MVDVNDTQQTPKMGSSPSAGGGEDLTVFAQMSWKS